MQGVSLTSEELRKLLSCGCSDAAALYLYCKAGLARETALDALHFTVPQIMAATDCLRQLGLWEEEKTRLVQPDRPEYTEQDVRRFLTNKRGSFSLLIGEAQRRLGRTLSTEELKTLLSMTDYLQLPTEVIGLLLSYCVERNRRRGSRAPSMRTIEKEAYRWADDGIDTLEAASYYVQTQHNVLSRVQQIRLMLQIDQRRLTPAEEKYVTGWIEMGFGDDAIGMAYERTCVNTGALKWAYMNSILKSWHEKGLHTPEEIVQKDTVKQQRGGTYQRHNENLTPLAKQAVERILAEERGD